MQNRDISIGVAAVVMGIMIGGVALQITDVDLAASTQIAPIRPMEALRNYATDNLVKDSLHAAAGPAPAKLVTRSPKTAADITAACKAATDIQTAVAAVTEKSLPTSDPSDGDYLRKFGPAKASILKALRDSVALHCPASVSAEGKNLESYYVNDCSKYRGARLSVCRQKNEVGEKYDTASRN